MTKCDPANAIMLCTHVTEDNAEAMSDQFPDLLCEECCNIMAEAEEESHNPNADLSKYLPKEVHVGCRSCILGRLARK